VRSALLRKGDFALSNAMGQAQIGTVNSVCGAMLERFAFEAGLATEKRVLDENQAGLIIREAMDEVLEEGVLDELISVAVRLGIEDCCLCSPRVKPWRSSLRNVTSQNGFCVGSATSWWRAFGSPCLILPSPDTLPAIRRL